MLRDARERAHHAPNSSKQSDERRAAHGDGKQNQARFQFQRFLRDDVFNRALDVFHVFDGDGLLKPFAARPAQPRVQFHATGLINHVERAAFHLKFAVEHIKHGFLRTEFFVEIIIQFLRAPHLHGFVNHDRPRDDGEDDEKDDDDLGFRPGLFQNIEEFRLMGGSPHDDKREYVHYVAHCLVVREGRPRAGVRAIPATQISTRRGENCNAFLRGK